jgi:hypothetical protein
MRPLEEAGEGPFLEQSALADAWLGRALGVREVQAVVGDELGARLLVGGKGAHAAAVAVQVEAKALVHAA